MVKERNIEHQEVREGRKLMVERPLAFCGYRGEFINFGRELYGRYRENRRASYWSY